MVVAFDYPTSASRQINTLANGFKGKATSGGGVTVTFELTGDPDTQFKHDDKAGVPARVSIFVQRCGDNYRDDNGRWWTEDFRRLADILNKGPQTISVPFSGGWTNVQGKKGRPDVKSICNVGLAFGANAVTHGNWATGPARLEITQFEVN